MGHKFGNIQIGLGFLSVLKLIGHSKSRVKKNEHGEGKIVIRTFVLKVMNNERKKLAHHEIIDCIAERAASVIIEQKIKIVDLCELMEVMFLIYLLI